MGSLLETGRWQDEAAADWVFHLPSPPPRSLMTRRRAESIARQRLVMDAHLLRAIANGATRRIVYVDDTSSYETTDCRAITEDEPLTRSGWARTLTPALDRVEEYVLTRPPIVTILPGRVYGDGSWFRNCVIAPVMAGRRVLQFGRSGPWVSPIHVRDCARALVHLAEYGTAGNRYFVVNNEPIRVHEFARTFAYLANRRLRVWTMPAWTARFIVDPMHAGRRHADAVFANIRLRGTGFTFHYPTLEDGVRQIISTLHE